MPIKLNILNVNYSKKCWSCDKEVGTCHHLWWNCDVVEKVWCKVFEEIWENIEYQY